MHLAKWLLQEARQIGAIAALCQGQCQRLQLLVGHPSMAPGDLLRSGNLEPLPLFKGLDETAGLLQAVVGTGI